MTLGEAVVAIERALAERGRSINSIHIDRRKGDAWAINVSFEPAYVHTQEAFGSTWHGFTKFFVGAHPEVILAQIARMDLARQE